MGRISTRGNGRNYAGWKIDMCNGMVDWKIKHAQRFVNNPGGF